MRQEFDAVYDTGRIGVYQTYCAVGNVGLESRLCFFGPFRVPVVFYELECRRPVGANSIKPTWWVESDSVNIVPYRHAARSPASWRELDTLGGSCNADLAVRMHHSKALQ